MRYFFYNFVTFLALPVIVAAFGVHRKYRQGFWERMGFIPQQVQSQLKGTCPIWLHAVSVGEVTASIPIVKKIKEEHPGLKIVLSTITATGNYTARQKIPEVDFVIYFPYDYFFVVNRVINIINPCIFIHTETEIWPNFIWALQRRGIPSVIVNGRISWSSSRRYKLFGWFFKRVFNNISAFGMQSYIDYQRAINIGANPKRVLLTGNMKFDQKKSDFNPAEKEKLLRNFNLNPKDQIFIAGSTHSGEEEIILDVFQQLLQEHPRLILILAPRHPERFQEVEKLVKGKGFLLIRKTQIKKNKPPFHPQVILLDTIGELSLTYNIGEIIFVGGSLVNIGGHNILEPLVYKKPVLFGPYMQNFSEIAQALGESGAGILVETKEDLFTQAQRLLNNKGYAKMLGEKGFQVIQRHQGATDRNMEMINRFIKD
ncbi:MAG: 3-deoxy-D-manno-octulosonic acid transferase [Deltaproteobacteria bacterium]|nr:3-deoxy-D-manno-octulosonic acid transferase [Deltaproteobacteria bacterium]